MTVTIFCNFLSTNSVRTGILPSSATLSFSHEWQPTLDHFLVLATGLSWIGYQHDHLLQPLRCIFYIFTEVFGSIGSSLNNSLSFGCFPSYFNKVIVEPLGQFEMPLVPFISKFLEKVIDNQLVTTETTPISLHYDASILMWLDLI